MTISSTYGTWTVTNWPWPKIYFTGSSYVAVAVDSSNISLFELYNQDDQWYAERCTILKTTIGRAVFPITFPATFEADTATINSIDVSGFGPFYLVSLNAVDDEPRCWYRDPNRAIGDGCLVEISGDGSIPRFRTSCNFKGQIVTGGIYSSLSPWNGISPCSVAWSGIGRLEFNPKTDPTAGFMPMPWDDYGEGEIYKVIRVGNFVCVYGDSGRALLVPVTKGSVSTFGLKELSGAGISSPYHVAGDVNSHCFIDTNHDVWLVTDRPEITKLGHREWMDELFATGDDVVVSFSSQKKLFYFSDGNQCFVLSEYGMGECNQLPTSVVNYRGTQAGFFADTEDYEFRFKLDGMQFGTSSLKTLESLDFLIDYIKTSCILSAGADFKYNYNESLRTGNWLRLNPQGSVAPIITASEFNIKLKGTDYRSATALKIKDATGTFKFSDKRMIRGTYASKDYA